MIQTIAWTGNSLRLLDQTRLPLDTVYVDITDQYQTWDAIKRLVVRGAPAIGVAAAFGAYLGTRNVEGNNTGEFLKKLKQVCDYIASSRPTAVNLFWALERIRHTAAEAAGVQPGRSNGASPPCHVVREIQEAILDEALVMLEEDRRVCRAIGENGLALLIEQQGTSNGQPHRILTHCNAGSLATVQYGTALAPVYVGAERGIKFHVYSDETRPLLQGSRITAFELQANGIPVTVICDNMAATVMQQGKVDAVIVGADRITSRGDVANKIGTLGVAVLAKHFGIPFYVAAPLSTIDFKLSDGREIPIEQRDGQEITNALGRQTAPSGVDVYNPAFDVTPADLVSAIITEQGVVRPPFEAGLKEALRKSRNAAGRMP